MTDNELIEKLKTMPLDAMVVADAYEDGYNGIKKANTVYVTERPDPEWYYGKYVKSVTETGLQVVYLDVERGKDTHYGIESPYSVRDR